MQNFASAFFISNYSIASFKTQYEIKYKKHKSLLRPVSLKKLLTKNKDFPKVSKEMKAYTVNQ